MLFLNCEFYLWSFMLIESTTMSLMFTNYLHLILLLLVLCDLLKIASNWQKLLS